MSVTTAFQFRLRRARALVDSGAVCLNGGPGSFDVQSQSDPEQKYHVQVSIDPESQDVTATHCDCPDWQTMWLNLEEWIAETGKDPHPGISHINYSPLCKHVGAALIQLGVLE